MSACPELIRLKPVLHNNIWGGRKLHDVFGYDIPDGPVGECWGISAHPHGDCTVDGGPYDGCTLSQLWSEHHELFEGAEGDRFPLLIKILDAREDLSIQVHPDDEYAMANENGSLGKHECWYVMDCDEDGQIVVGQRAHDRAEFEQMVAEGRWNDMVNLIPIKPGDFFDIKPGTVHAIKGGTQILETQQSSDVTYRVYDYDRRQPDGSLRELHLKQAADVIDYDAVAPASGDVTAPEENGITKLMSCKYFDVPGILLTRLTPDSVLIDELALLGSPVEVEAPEQAGVSSVEWSASTPVDVFTAEGRHVARTTFNALKALPLRRGVYVVRSADDVKKIVRP